MSSKHRLWVGTRARNKNAPLKMTQQIERAVFAIKRRPGCHHKELASSILLTRVAGNAVVTAVAEAVIALARMFGMIVVAITGAGRVPVALDQLTPVTAAGFYGTGQSRSLVSGRSLLPLA
jgi:hypothetical protein